MKNIGAKNLKADVQKRLSNNRYMAVLIDPEDGDVIARYEGIETEKNAWDVALALKMGFEAGASSPEEV